ncbi:hypothetical protein ACSVDE_19045 [Pseudalkalibacillus sp. Hm43]|uniref:hypothetical protein n=1 Tax=Pseudalkalibacillus sp. Hm43 TaxID=3450742 RepID=UPI003F420747
MKKWVVLFLGILFLVACSQEPAVQQEEEKPTTEGAENTNQEENTTEESDPEDTTSTTEETEDTAATDEEEPPQEGEEAASVYIDFEPYTESFSVNGILVGDTKEHVVETLGEPFKRYEGDVRWDYTFQDAWYGETLSFDFDDLGVNYIQVDTITEKGRILEDAFIQSFDQDNNGQIYKATDQFLKDFDESALSLFVFFVHDDSILVGLKNADAQHHVSRTYMVTHIDHWAWARGWNMEIFQDETLFTKVNADIAIADQ